MAVLENVFERVGRTAGIGIALGAVAAVPLLTRGARPVIKGAIKGYLRLTERAKELSAETSERLQDLYAEARSEYQNGTAAMARVVTEEAPKPKAERAPRRNTRKTTRTRRSPKPAPEQNEGPEAGQGEG